MKLRGRQRQIGMHNAPLEHNEDLRTGLSEAWLTGAVSSIVLPSLAHHGHAQDLSNPDRIRRHHVRSVMRAACDVGQESAVRVETVDDLRRGVDEVAVRRLAVLLVVRSALVVGEPPVGVEQRLHGELVVRLRRQRSSARGRALTVPQHDWASRP